MMKFLKRFFLFFFPIFACLFLVSLLVPVAAFAHTTGLFIPEASDGNFSILSIRADTPTPTPTTVPTSTATVVPSPTPLPTATPTPLPTATPTPPPTTEPATPTPTIAPSPTATTVPTPLPTSTPSPGNTTNDAPVALNALIFAMGGVGVIMVIVGVILYFVYSRPI